MFAAVTFVGADGALAGAGVVIEADAEAGLVPTAFVAVTVNVYETEDESQVIVQEVLVVVHVSNPGELVTV